MNTKFLNAGVITCAIIFFIVIVSHSGCKKDSTPGPDQVFMQNTMFNPVSLTVAVNATVTWTNKDNTSHNVTSDSGWFASSTINPGGTYSHQFTAKGIYNYQCTIHQGMNGTVVVQ
jgi:plastocyanin